MEVTLAFFGHSTPEELARAADEKAFFRAHSKWKRNLDELRKGLKKSDLCSLRLLWSIAYESTELLNEFARNRYKMVSRIARNYAAVPVLWDGRRFDSEHKFLAKLCLNEANAEAGGSLLTSQKNPVPARQWALFAYEVIRELRLANGRYLLSLTLVPSTVKTPKGAGRLLRFSWARDHDSVSEFLRKKAYFLEKAAKLKPFSPESARDWWPLAKEILDYLTQDRIADFPGLADHAKTKRVADLKISEKGRGTRNGEVHKNIRPRFLCLPKSDRKRSPGAKAG